MRTEAGEGAEIEDDRQMRRQDARADCTWGLPASFIEQEASGNVREEAASDQFKDRVGGEAEGAAGGGQQTCGRGLRKVEQTGDCQGHSTAGCRRETGRVCGWLRLIR